jgi:O-antigen/teichoic acid export membrane protein
LEWTRQAGIAILDQALFSGASLFLNLYLARKLSPGEYGSFALMYSILIVTSGFHNALLLEPMTVIGPATYSGTLNSYLRVQIRMHMMFGAVVFAIALLSGLVLTHIHAPGYIFASLVGCGIAIPFVLFMWQARRMCYVVRKPRVALLGSALNLAIVVVSVIVLVEIKELNAITAACVLAVGGLFTSLFVLSRRPLRPAADSPLPNLKRVIGENWAYGKWAMISGIMFPLSTQLQAFYATAILGIAALGTVRAMQVIPSAMVQFNTAITVLILPAMAADFGRNAYSDLRKKAALVSVLAIVFSLTYALVLFLFGSPIESLIYKGKFAQYAWMMAVLALVPAFNAIATGFGLVFRSVQMPKFDLLSYSLAAPITAIVSYFLIRHFGRAGTAWSIVAGALSLALGAGFVYIFGRRHLFRPRTMKVEMSDFEAFASKDIGD